MVYSRKASPGHPSALLPSGGGHLRRRGRGVEGLRWESWCSLLIRGGDGGLFARRPYFFFSFSLWEVIRLCVFVWRWGMWEEG